jgi:hypothetical protein
VLKVVLSAERIADKLKFSNFVLKNLPTNDTNKVLRKKITPAKIKK